MLSFKPFALPVEVLVEVFFTEDWAALFNARAVRDADAAVDDEILHDFDLPLAGLNTVDNGRPVTGSTFSFSSE